MKNIDKMIKCRALFLQSVAYLNGENINIDDNFNLILESFLETYFYGNEDYFNLIYYFDIDEEGTLAIREDEEWANSLNKYLTYFMTNNHDKVKEIYDEIGREDVKKISTLAEMFYAYVIALNDMSNTRIRS